MTRNPKLAAAAVVAAVLALAGVAFGAIPGANGVITSCYSQATGTWRPIDVEKSPADKCKAAEKQLSWNQQGPKGDKGDAGLQGPAARLTAQRRQEVLPALLHGAAELQRALGG